MDKIDRLLDAIEHPERYTVSEIEAMLSDPEVREVYELLDKTKSSVMPISTPDVDAEWNAFERSHHKRKFRILNLFSRNVAASIALGIASLAAVAAVVGVSVNYVMDKKVEHQASVTTSISENNVVTEASETITEEISETEPETVVFDNEPLEVIVNHIAKHYGYTTDFATDTQKSLRLYFRWNQAQTIDEVIESLNNFEQIHLTVKDKTIKID